MLSICQNIIDPLTEKIVVNNFSMVGKSTNTLRHSVQRFGSNYPYSNYHISNFIPDIFKNIFFEKIPSDYRQLNFNSVTVNEYHKGDSIEWHTDSLDSGNEIVVVSLMSDCVICFRENSSSQKLYNSLRYFEFNVPRYSVYSMKGELRHLYKHSVVPVIERRMSIVYRLCKQPS